MIGYLSRIMRIITNAKRKDIAAQMACIEVCFIHTC